MSLPLFSPSNFSTFLTTLLFIRLCFSSSSSSARPEPRIVGGERCSVDKHPFIVSIVFRDPTGDSQCGGGLILAKWVLTAAHCFADNERENFDSVEVQAGSSRSLLAKSKNVAGEEPQVRRVAKVHFPEDSDAASGLVNDIALMQLDDGFELNDHVALVEMPEPPSDDAEFCSTALTMGWGGTEAVKFTVSDDSEPSSWLKCLELPMVSASVCESPSDIVDKILCAEFSEKGKGNCMGDSGGPIVCKNQPTILIALVKAVPIGCGLGKKSKVVYTRVDAYLDWIYEQIPDDEKGAYASYARKPETENGSGYVHAAHILLVVLLPMNVLL